MRSGASGDFWARVIPGTILCAVALLQIFLSTTMDLSPWKGGGFGMFASTDHWQWRFFLLEGVNEQGDACVIHLPYWNEKDHASGAWSPWSRLSVFPQRDPLAHHFDALLSSGFVVGDGTPQSEFIAQLEGGRPPADTHLPEDVATARFCSLESPEGSGSPGFELVGGRVSLYRLKLDPATDRLGWIPVSEPIVRGDWP